MCISLLLTGGGDGKHDLGAETGNCCNMCDGGQSKINTANKEIPTISPCDVDCGMVVGVNCRWTVKCEVEDVELRMH